MSPSSFVSQGMTTLKNLMPHTFTLVAPAGTERRKDGIFLADGAPLIVLRTVDKEPVPARATQAPAKAGEPVDGIPTTLPGAFGPVENLPDPQEGVGYIVSFITVGAARASGRTVSDLFTPGDLVRNTAGQPIGCLNLARHT